MPRRVISSPSWSCSEMEPRSNEVIAASPTVGLVLTRNSDTPGRFVTIRTRQGREDHPRRPPPLLSQSGTIEVVTYRLLLIILIAAILPPPASLADHLADGEYLVVDVYDGESILVQS